MEAASPANLPRVLVVDDCPDTALSLALLLRLWGHEAATARDGPAALELARSFRPDAVVLDLGLPRLSGWDVARRLRQMPGGDVLLVALSGRGAERDRRLSQEAGIDFHLTKPCDPEDLRRLLAAARPGARALTG